MAFTIGGASVTVRIAFATDPGSAPTWTDVSAYVRAFSTSRGRQRELDSFQAGRASIVLDNRDRRFEPTFAAGAYSPNIRPMRRVDIRVVYNAITYDVFHGYITDWPPTYPNRKDALVAVTAYDAFRVFGLRKLSETYVEERTDVRIGNVLDDLNWPAADRSLDTGKSTVQAVTLSQAVALTHLQDVERSENGRLFMNGAGVIVFRNRHNATRPPYSNSQATFGEGGGELPYSDIALAFDDQLIYNELTVTRTGGAAQTATDATSQTRYYVRTLTRTILVPTDGEALSAARWLRANYREPGMRCTRLVIEPQRDEANLWPQVLGRDLGDRVTCKRTPPGGGADMSSVNFVEGIEHAVGSDRVWRTAWRLSPTDGDPWLIIGHATRGKIGTGRLGY